MDLNTPITRQDLFDGLVVRNTIERTWKGSDMVIVSTVTILFDDQVVSKEEDYTTIPEY